MQTASARARASWRDASMAAAQSAEMDQRSRVGRPSVDFTTPRTPPAFATPRTAPSAVYLQEAGTPACFMPEGHRKVADRPQLVELREGDHLEHLHDDGGVAPGVLRVAAHLIAKALSKGANI